MRKMISFKIENLSEKERLVVDTWANGQSNIQQSLANVIMHIVTLVGNADVMDFDVQRKLHTLFANSSISNEREIPSEWVEPTLNTPTKEPLPILHSSDIISRFEEDDD